MSRLSTTPGVHFDMPHSPSHDPHSRGEGSIRDGFAAVLLLALAALAFSAGWFGDALLRLVAAN
jgi:hypothetical protein